jgi:myo-inositol-1(or 4)-monophosphatase
MTPSSFPADLEFLIGVAQQAGDQVLAMQDRGLTNIGSKSSEIDLVTEADLASEKLIRAALHARHPEFDFWGEESNEPPHSEFFWVVDPIDGTNNFANGLAYFAVNLALCQGDDSLIGVTLELPARRIYYAQKGQGAFVRHPDGREKRLRVNDVSTLSRAFLTTGFPYHRSEHADNNLLEFGYFMGRSQGVRCMGSAALDLANVAAGALAGYWEGWLKPWDAAPGVLLVSEAGGRVTDYRGEPWQLRKHTLIASNGNPDIHAALVEGIRTARSELAASRLPASETA